MDDTKSNETNSTFAQDRAAVGTTAATAAAKAPAARPAGEVFANWLNRLIGETPKAQIRVEGRDYDVVELAPDGNLTCFASGTELKHIVALEEKYIDMLLPQVLKN